MYNELEELKKSPARDDEQLFDCYFYITLLSYFTHILIII